MARIASQDAQGTSTASTSVAATYAATPTSGNLLVAHVYAAVATVITPPSGWTQTATGAVGQPANGTVWTFVKTAGASEPSTVTFTGMTGATGARIHIYEYSGYTVTVDGTPGAAASGASSVTTQSAGSTTTGNANDVLVACCAFGGATSAWSVDSGFTLLQTNARMASAELVVAATGTYAPNFSWTSAMKAGGLITAVQASGSSPSAADTASGADAASVTATLTAADTAHAVDAATVATPSSGAGGLPTLTVELEDASGNFTNDISAFCHLPSGVDVTRGRVDEQTDVTSGEVTLLLHNLDGRFTLGSAFYNGITVDKRIRITETYNTVVYRRFVGYVQEWPTQWASGVANLAYASITAIDRQARLARRKLLSLSSQEILADSPAYYYPLGEAADSTSAGDLSGNAGPVLTIVAPDGFPAPLAFGAPVSGLAQQPTGVLFAGGQFLQGPTVTFGTAESIEVVFQCASAPAATEALAIGVMAQLMMNTSGQITSGFVTSPLSYADGLPHHAVATFGASTFNLYVDGTLVATTGGGGGGSATLSFGGSISSVGLATLTGTLLHCAYYVTALAAPRVLAHANAILNGFATDRADQRIARLAGHANIAAGDQNLETGQQPSIAAQETEDVYALDAMRQVVQAEGGLLFISGDGKLTMQNKSHRVLKAIGSPVATLTADQVDPKALVITGDKNYLYNTGTGSRAGGGQQRVVNAASVAKYEEYDVQRDVALLPTDELLLNQLQWLTAMYGEPSARVSALTLNLVTLPAATVAALLALELGDFVRLSTLPTQAPAASLDLLVEGSKESLTETSWTLALNTVPAPLFRAWVLDNTTYSVLDSTTRLYF